MSSIGPQLPSQPSTKRKHSAEPDDDHGAASSSSKHARRNADEINLDDDDASSSSSSDDDDYGPRAPAAAPIDSKPSLGPSLPPPTPSTRNQDEIDLDDSASSSSHTGPAPPPPPPSHATAATAQPIPASSDSDSDSDDYGPALPSASNTRRGPIGPTLPPTTDPSAPTRDEWMLAPPVNTGYTERDPTKLKARKFTSSKPGRGGGGPAPSSSSGSGLAAIWTETPEEKLKRLQDAVLGRSDASGQSAEAAAAATARTRDEDERNSKVAAAIAAHRGRSLYDEHQAIKNGGGGGGKHKKTGKGGEEEDDPSKRAFDRTKDMALGSKIGTAQRRELVAKSANFGGRFQKGSFL
ncbi:hypothetical protein CRV24_002228 [Beauveria bassiana]|nr:hypothetical protein CRV24_002228 [Beauveria bassiana]KAH8717588.1 hypothetical protein HC256_002272 [Beauveria bassiana]